MKKMIGWLLTLFFLLTNSLLIPSGGFAEEVTQMPAESVPQDPLMIENPAPSDPISVTPEAISPLEPVAVPTEEPILAPLPEVVPPEPLPELAIPKILISEILAGSEVNPEKDHFFELYNPGGEEILLFGWQIRGVTAGGKWINLVEENYRAIQPKTTFLVSHYTNSRSSALEIRPQVNKTSIQFPAGPISVELKDPEGRISDTLFIDPSQFPFPDPAGFYSYERTLPDSDGTLSASWSLAHEAINLKSGVQKTWATPGSVFVPLPPEPVNQDPPLQEEPEEEIDEEVEMITPPPRIVINEILPNPRKKDNENEFIELLNLGNTPVDLRGWEMDDENTEDEKSYFLIDQESDYVLDPGEFLPLYSYETLISLNDLGDGVELFDTEGDMIDSYFYAPDYVGRSWGRRPENPEEWFSLFHPTPGNPNIDLNTAPVAVIALQKDTRGMSANVTSESYDIDGDLLTYEWTFEPGVILTAPNPPRYAYTTAGMKTITLKVTDPLGLFSETSVIFEAVPTGRSYQTNPSSYPDYALINEAMVNPEGRDEEGEWIELFNSTPESIDLSGWLLDDEDGASSPFRIPDGTWLEPGAYLVFREPDLGLSFRNSEDSVRLLTPDQTVKQMISYTGAQENQSFALNLSGEWIWTPLFTLGTLNQFPEPPPSYSVGSVVIEKVLPNPAGEDQDYEKITLFNITGESIDLKDWQLMDEQGGSYLFPSIPLGPKSRFTLDQTEFRINLNNQADMLRLLDPAGNEIDSLAWADIQSGQWVIRTNHLADGMTAEVPRVVDGDTIIIDLDGTPLPVRLIGLNTPETVHPFKPVERFGKEASEYLKKVLQDQTVTLSFDETRADKYGRLLAYVYLGDRFINAELIEKGYGFAYTRFSFQHLESFKALEEEAKNQGVGLWGEKSIVNLMQQGKINFEEDPSEEILEKGEEDLVVVTEEITEKEEIVIPEGSNDHSSLQGDISASNCLSPYLKINSILPNAKRGETMETIQLINLGAETVCLTGWQLDDDLEKGSKFFMIQGGSIAPGGIRTFRQTETKINLNNKDDCASLIDPIGNLMDQICYERTHKNELFTHAGGDWVPKRRIANRAPQRPSRSLGYARDDNGPLGGSLADLSNEQFVGQIQKIDETEQMIYLETNPDTIIPVSYAAGSFNMAMVESLLGTQNQPVEVWVRSSGQAKALVALHPVTPIISKTDQEPVPKYPIIVLLFGLTGGGIYIYRRKSG